MWGIYQDTLPVFTLVDTWDTEERAYYEAVYLNESSEDYRYYVAYIGDRTIDEATAPSTWIFNWNDEDDYEVRWGDE